MEEENAVEILQRYRRDRRKLLDFMLAGSLIKKVIMPPGAVTLDDVDLDQVSVDYVINCAKKGGMLELAEAIRDYHDHSGLPYMNSVGTADEFFLATNPESSGSPPKRAPPPIPILTSSSSAIATNPEWCESPSVPSSMRSESIDSPQAQELTVDDIDDFEDDDDLDEVGNFRISRRTANDAADLVPKLPSFATGITDDDLRETAFEILLACAGASGGLIVPSKEKKKEKSRSRLIKKLGRKSESVSQSQSSSGLVALLEMMRGQMEISEAMDIRTRQGLLNALAGKSGKRMDSLLVPLELLCCVSRTEFSDKKAYLRWQKRQLNMLAEGLINNPVVGFGESGRKATDLKSLLQRIEESESLPSSAGEVQRAECLKSLREVAISLAERPARGDLTGEVCHWADGYHMNVRLYEKLLLCVFDILNEGKLTEEVEEILELLKSTWRVLGITETLHYTCYAWVLFRQHVITSERGLLRHAIQQLKKIPLKEQRGPQERIHLKTLQCRVENEEISFLESFLSPIRSWADKQLGDYHLHFAEGSLVMEDTVTVAMITWRLLLEESDRAMYSNSSDREQIESYISSSIKNTFTRVSLAIDRSDRINEHPLALLAEETKKLMKKDSTIFMPILSQRHPQAIAFSASLVHKLYGNKLKPFLDGTEHLTEDVVSVFPVADSLEQYLLELMTSVCGEDTNGPYFRKLIPYELESLSGTLVLRWINSQLGRILSWVERAFKQEHWDPISPQQRHGSSIVEVFRIVEETVDQFFELKVPMRSIELSALLRGIDNAFQVYANHVMEKLASKDDLVPPVPVFKFNPLLLHLHLLPQKFLIVCVSEMFSSSTLVYSLTLFLSLSLLFFLLFLSPHILLSSSRHNLLSTADDLDDLSLFHRAAVSSSNNRRLISLSPAAPPKIAFLFLTNSDLTFLPLWESFFQGHEDLYNAYIHADPSSGVSPLLDSSIKAKFIPAKKTARASPTLISAERRLIARAILDDPNNLYFALVSQHCIPLHSFSYIHNHLFADPSSSKSHQSFIEILADEPFLPKRYIARGEDAMLPEIRYEDFRVGSQFFVLAKRHALMVMRERKLWRKFRLPCLDTESCYPEEHYFPTLLSLEDPKGCSHFTLTRVNWTGSVGGHPHTYGASEVSPQLIHTLRRSNSSLDYFFARKFSPESLQPLMEIADAVIFRD